MALLNSKLFNYIYEKKFKSTKKVFSEIQARSVGELPVKRNGEIEAQIVIYVDEAIQAKKQNFNKDISTIESKIDKLIYEIYGLNEEQIQMVEGE